MSSNVTGCREGFAIPRPVVTFTVPEYCPLALETPFRCSTGIRVVRAGGAAGTAASVTVMPFDGKPLIVVAADNEVFTYFRTNLYSETRAGR